MRRFYRGVFVLFLMAAVLVGCGGSKQQTQTATSLQSGNVYVTGQDAPLPSVLAFQITIDSLKLSNNTTSVTLENPGTVEFSRLLGLRTLLSVGSIPAGTYTSATVAFSAPTISYLDMSTTPPSVKTINGTLGSITLNLPLNPPLTVGANGLGGLHLHFDLSQSLMMSAGQMTGAVNPSMNMRVLTIGDDDAEIDELRGGVVSVDVANNVFVMQRPMGRQITVHVNKETQWQGSDNLNTIAPPTTVEVSGHIQADGSILADAVEVLTHDKTFMAGLVLSVTPPSGSASNFTLLARESMPAIPGVTVPGTAQINVLSNTVFDIRNFNLPVEAFLFNSSQLVAGQRVGIGGTINSTTTPNSVDARRVVLRRQGLDGVPGAVQVTSGNIGQFMLQNNGMFGYILGGSAMKVTTSNATVFKNLAGLKDVANATRVRVVGLVLKDSSGNPVLVASYVAKLQ